MKNINLEKSTKNIKDECLKKLIQIQTDNADVQNKMKQVEQKMINVQLKEIGTQMELVKMKSEEILKEI